MTHKLTPEEQQYFDALINAMDEMLGSAFTLDRDTFMIEPLRYSQTAFFPVDKQMTRRRIRSLVELVISECGFALTHTQQGKGVYLVDRYKAGMFTVYVACARRGGRLIGFGHVNDLTT